MKGKLPSALLAVVLLGVAVSLGVISAKRVQRQAKVGALCDATREARWDDALAFDRSLVGPGPEGRIAAECLCWAYASAERLPECAQMVDEILQQPEAADWVPDITVARLVARHRAELGRFREAAGLAQRAAKLYPRDTQLLELEMTNRTVFEDEAAVLDDMASRLTDDLAESLALRLVLSAGYERRGDFERSLEVLGDTPPPEPGPAQTAWFEGRAGAYAGSQQVDKLKQTYALWESMGGDPVEMRARYALRLSMFGLSDGKYTRIQLLERSLAEEEKLHHPGIRRSLYERLIGHYLVDGYKDKALALYDRAKQRLDNVLITREEILRSLASSSRLSDLKADRKPNTLVFRAPADGPSGTLLVSPAPDIPPDTPFVARPLPAGGSVRVERLPDIHPQRWVFRDEGGDTVASGTVWPDRPETTIAIEPRAPVSPRTFTPKLAPGDGRRRLFVVINDCEDWRIAKYLLARGELPVHRALLERGYSAVLESTPAFTGAAMESLVWPTRGKHITFLGVANRLGIELGGLSSVGQNPLGFLKQVLPESENLFERIGEGPYVTANLLFSHGYIDAGDHAELIGPHGERRPAPDLLAMRPLTPEESEGIPPVLKGQRSYRAEVEKMAAEFDSAHNLARGGEVDLLLIRIEPLDILTHTFFTEMLRSEQDDAQDTLLWAYRYIDERLAEVWQALDADDVFVVMSDHGIRTALEHDEAAIFVAVGEGVPKGRAPGRPHLKGVPHLLANLLGVDTTWPDTQIAAWAGAPVHAEKTQPAR